MDKVGYEQPDVAPLQQLYVIVEGVTDSSTGSPQPFQAAWTTANAANDLLGSSYRPFSSRVSGCIWGERPSRDTARGGGAVRDVR